MTRNLGRFWLRRVRTCPLRKHNNPPDDKCCNYCGSKEAAHVQAAMIYGFVEKIANCGTKRSSKDKGRPEKRDP